MEKLAYAVFCVFIFGFSLFRGALVSDDVALNTFRNQGYTNIHITDKAFFMVGLRGCDGSDAARFTAMVTNAQGKEVPLYVCSGWPFKGGTIRNP